MPLVRVERPLRRSLGARVRAARERAVLSPGEVARRVGVSLATYGRIERGECFPSLPALRRLCVTLGIGSDELLGLGADTPRLRRLLHSAIRLEDSQLRMLDRLVRALGVSTTTRARGEGGRARASRA